MAYMAGAAPCRMARAGSEPPTPRSCSSRRRLGAGRLRRDRGREHLPRGRRARRLQEPVHEVRDGIGLTNSEGIAAVEGRLRPEEPRRPCRDDRPTYGPQPQARHDGRLRALERHAPRVPGGTLLRAEPATNNRRARCPWPAAPGANCEYGGEELWGFVPYDQLLGLGLRTKTEAAGTESSTRDEHVYMMAGSIRFSDVFVPGPVSLPGVPVDGRCLAPRDVRRARHRRQVPHRPRRDGDRPLHLERHRPRVGPSRCGAGATRTRRTGPCGSDTQPQRRRSRPATATRRWARPGRCPWSATSTASNPSETSTRRRAGPARTGPSSSCSWARATVTTPAAPRTRHPCEGRTFYTLDALSGDVIASVDVGRARARAARARTRSSPTRPASTRRPSRPSRACTPPSTSPEARLHRRHARPPVEVPDGRPHDVAIPFADLGRDQPIGSPGRPSSASASTRTTPTTT